MFTQIHYPRKLSGETLDLYLDQGWFRMGQMIFTCQFLCFHGQLYTAVWTRLDLSKHTFRRGQRKLMSKNSRTFRIHIDRAKFDYEKDALYQKHRKRFEGYVANSLHESLHGESSRDIYDTREVCIYDGDKLVGVSFFDVGEDSLASIMGLFDPDYQHYSLGYYTMLLEIEWAKQNDLLFYYPGYVVPGYGRFDYKLRVGEVDYFDIFKKDWQPWSELENKALISEILKTKLAALQSELSQRGVHTQKILYPLYDRDVVGHEREYFVYYPMFLSCYHHKSNHRFLLIEYDLYENTYRLSRARKHEDSFSYLSYMLYEDYDEQTTFLEFLVREEVYIETNSVDLLTERIHAYSRVIRKRQY